MVKIALNCHLTPSTTNIVGYGSSVGMRLIVNQTGGRQVPTLIARFRDVSVPQTCSL